MRPVSQWIQLALLGICIAPLGWALELHRGSNLFHPDSPSYFVFDPSRTVGYPAFLWAVQFVTGSLSWAAPVQTVLVAFALFALGLAIYRATRRIAFAVAAQIALVSSVGIWSFSGVLMTEAVATSAVAFWCAILILNVFKPTLKAIALLIIFAGLATSIRPALVTLFAGTALFSLFVSGNRNKFAALVMTIAGFAIAWEATPASQWLVHGSVDTASPFARGILQHSLFCAPGADPKTAEGRFVESFAKPVRRYVDQAPSGAISKVRVEYSTRLRFGLIIPTLAKVHRFRWGWQVDPLLLRIADEKSSPILRALSEALPIPTGSLQRLEPARHPVTSPKFARFLQLTRKFKSRTCRRPLANRPRLPSFQGRFTSRCPNACRQVTWRTCPSATVLQ